MLEHCWCTHAHAHPHMRTHSVQSYTRVVLVLCSSAGPALSPTCRPGHLRWLVGRWNGASSSVGTWALPHPSAALVELSWHRTEGVPKACQGSKGAAKGAAARDGRMAIHSKGGPNSCCCCARSPAPANQQARIQTAS